MAFSQRYRDLAKAVRKLRQALLPGKFDPTGTYRSPERVHLRSVSFRILVHAEVESFIEDRSLELFDFAWKKWREHQVPSRVMLGLLSFSGVATLLPPGKLGGDPENQKSYQDIVEPLKKAQKVWRWTYDHNHGVKEENVLALLLPLGIAATDLDTTLLADLTSFGSDRGAVAHNSSVGVGRYADPRSEHQRAAQLVRDLGKIDDLIADAINNVGMLSKVVAS